MPATLWRGPYEREAGTPGKREGACSHDHSRGKASDEWSLGCPLLLDFVGFTQAELQSFRNASVPDLVGPELKLLFVGINPGLWTAATQTHFAHPGNRFYPALRLAAILDRDFDRGRPMRAQGQGGAPRAAEAVAEVSRLFSMAAQPPRWPMYLRQVKQFLRNVDQTFDERKFGFNSLNDLLRACQREGLFRMERDRQGVIRF